MRQLQQARVLSPLHTCPWETIVSQLTSLRATACPVSAETSASLLCHWKHVPIVAAGPKQVGHVHGRILRKCAPAGPVALKLEHAGGLVATDKAMALLYTV